MSNVQVVKILIFRSIGYNVQEYFSKSPFFFLTKIWSSENGCSLTIVQIEYFVLNLKKGM